MDIFGELQAASEVPDHCYRPVQQMAWSLTQKQCNHSNCDQWTLRSVHTMGPASSSSSRNSQTDFTSYLEKKGTMHQNILLYHPLANAGVERFNKVLKYGLWRSDARKKTVLSCIKHYYWATDQCLTRWQENHPPNSWFGRTFRVPLDTVHPLFAADKPPDDTKLQVEVQKYLETLNKYYD